MENKDQHFAVPKNIHTLPMHLHRGSENVWGKGDLQHHRISIMGRSNQNKKKSFGRSMYIFLRNALKAGSVTPWG